MKFWVPLSRLSYSAYLIHILFLLSFYSTQEHPLHIVDLNIVRVLLVLLFK